MKKKIFSIIIIFLLVSILFACNGNKLPDNGEDEEPVYKTVTFMVDDIKYLEVLVEVEHYATRPDNPEKPENADTFDGWYKTTSYNDVDKWFFDDEKVLEDITLYARWKYLDEEEEYFELLFPNRLPNLSRLDDAVEDDFTVLEDAPDLFIIGVVLDTYYYYLAETMSGYEYIKVYNNTAEPYNMKNHRLVLADPTQGQNYEKEGAKEGNEVLVTGYLFNAFIDEDVMIDPFSTLLIWLKPYYWTIGSGTNAYNKLFSADLVHTTTGGQKGAFEQTIDDFKEFWELDSESNVYEMTNMPMIAKRAIGDSGTDQFFPMISPGAGTPYTHLNASLLRAIEIQKFDDQGGSAEVNVLNKYNELTPDKQIDPDLVYTKKVFNAFEIKDNDEVIDIYENFENAYTYFKPVVRAIIHGLIEESELTSDNEGTVSFKQVGSETNPGIRRWENTVELQYRPPKIGERSMQLIVPLRELAKFDKYLTEENKNVIRVVDHNDYRWNAQAIIYLTVDPEVVGIDNINFRRDEIKSPDRMSAANPKGVKKVNITRP